MDIDFLMPYLVHLVVLFISVGVIYVVYKVRSSRAVGAARNLPPGKKGLPYIGETLDYVLAMRRGTPEKFVYDRTTKYSQDVFRTSLLGEDMAIFCGAAGNKFLLSGQNKYVTSWWPDSLKKLWSDPSSVISIGEGTTKLRAYMLPFVKPDLLQGYIHLMNIMAKEHLDQYWSPHEQVQVLPLIKKYSLEVASWIFMGLQDDEKIERFARHFALLTAGLLSIPIDLPGTAFNRAVKAGRQIRQEFSPLIRKKKNELSEKGNTVASDLMDSFIMDGMTEVEISNLTIGLFIAGHDTISAAITFIISYLADYPDIYNKVFEEHVDILRSKEQSEALRWEDIQKMKYTWCVACEAMRLMPPANGTFREVITEFTYAGYTIPKGWKAYWTVHSTNKNPKYFPDPEKFDPSRFEGTGPAPYAFLPFGAGPKMCPGKEYARLEILTFIHNLVTRFKWEKLNPNEKISCGISPFPVEGLPIKLHPISIN